MNACVVRYSSAPIPDNADLDYEPPVSTATSNTSDAVRAAWVPLMSKLASGVATSPLRISNDSTPYWAVAGLGLDTDSVRRSAHPKRN